MKTLRDLGWWYWSITVGLLSAGLLGWIVGLYLAMHPCGEVFQRPWLKRVHG